MLDENLNEFLRATGTEGNVVSTPKISKQITIRGIVLEGRVESLPPPKRIDNNQKPVHVFDLHM
jgi:hypothetical protein